jgi:hypothetical protein
VAVKIGGSSDTVGSYVYEIWHELDEVFPRVEARYRGVDLEIFVVFRCLPDEIGRKSRREFAKAENALYLDMVVSSEKYEGLSKEEQRRDLSHVFYDYLADSLNRYRFPGLEVAVFLADLRAWLRETGWLKAWEIYVCADPPPGLVGVESGECACVTCILDRGLSR